MKPPEDRAFVQDERKPLLFGCIVLLIAVVVLGGAFLVGAWSMAQGYGPAIEKP